ncbi:GTP pyrophosphokinase family protein [Ligilactobacillus sp. WILCCON 0076]|uniref:GTP pyrophosphokinase family protein n=1 Tax=Ligilactobacillus ubinensis TaxID=2876789 RepID=A0A9X2JMK3_9LACO|nr:GTP pyrophosphokinase family protein [Ligilactobacillus ubinensis]MCP0887745.1 GTP pyrophosphokinase family protein [Ligilactobacillus ubinensis]
MMENWKQFLQPYEQAVSELKLKLRQLRDQYQQTRKHSPIEFVTGRVKPVTSIIEKMQRRQITVDRLTEDMEDIAGIRVMCQFVEDIYVVVDVLKNRFDMQVIEERDYITNQKQSGYRSYHIVIKYPIQRLSGKHEIKVEIQIRTLAMNFWATIEHSLNYKYKGSFPRELEERLRRSAEAAFLLDKEMSDIREEIKEAQALFQTKQSNQIFDGEDEQDKRSTNENCNFR